MQERTLRVLEFTKIREKLIEFAISELGKQECAVLVPSNLFSDVNLWQQETEEAYVVLTYYGQHPLIEFYDVRQYLKLCVIGSVLTPKALLDIAQSMRAARVARGALVTDRQTTPYLTSLASGLISNRHLEDDITSAIISEDELADNASAELSSIRRHMRQCNDKIKDKLNSMLHNSQMQKYLQDSIITVRNGRYVIPVKQESRANVPGLIHDQSASGATLFIEPMAIVEINNDLKQWASKEKQEIERILAEFSARIAPEAGGLQNNLEILSRLDFAFAKALLSRSMRGTAPRLNTAGYLRIIRGRHPLIDPEAVVPSDVWLGKDFTCLIITGPNTGGKTVTLKTVGLLTIMAQAGLHVPADYGTELAVYENVFADIGDEQSIEQSLSTFSSHMTNIVTILNNVTANSLALFDELGAGTDPTEGAALAISILNRLLELKVKTMATTHYSELKAYALSVNGVENASVEFDIESLRPTYRLSIGIPGKSNAFEISRKLGLGEDIIASAGELLSKEQVRFEDVISNAEYHRQIAEKERAIAEEARIEMQKLRDQAEQMRKDLEIQRETHLKKSKDEAKRILQRAQQESEQIISELKKQRIKGASELKEHELNDMKHKLQQGIDEMNTALTTPVDRLTKPLTNLKIGETVEIIHMNTKGTVQTKPDAKGEVQVQAGIIKLKVHISQLRRAEKEAAKKVRSGGTTSTLARSVTTEVDVRGKNLDEALLEVDLFLDNAVLLSLSTVSVIHGKGTGVLRSGVQDHLKRHPHVKEYRLGRYGEGEDGVTLITLK